MCVVKIGEGDSKQWRLTERGNQRAAIMLHFHVCRYLSEEQDKCAFLLPETAEDVAIIPKKGQRWSG